MTLSEALRNYNREKTVGSRILIIGLGNLGRRLAAGLSQHTEVGELILPGRNPEEGPALAEPLHPSQAESRFGLLKSLLEAEDR